jgi:hypothetical protein
MELPQRDLLDAKTAATLLRPPDQVVGAAVARPLVGPGRARPAFVATTMSR